MGAAFCNAVVAHNMRQSANVRGPGDNAHAESFWHSLKAELTRSVVFLTDQALRIALREYIRYYNRTRLHSSLNYTSPIAFEPRRDYRRLHFVRTWSHGQIQSTAIQS